MSTHTSPAPEAPKGPLLKRFKPHQLAIGLGIFMGVFTIGSGVIPQFTKWHDSETPNREVFEGIPGALQVAFYTVIPMLLVWGAFAFSQRVRNWERGAPDRRNLTKKNVVNRLKDFRAGAYMQTLLRDAGAGLMHSMIYFGFMALLGVTTMLEVDHQLPESLKFLHGDVYKAYSFFGDLAGLVFVIGIVWAAVRRYVQRPYRIRIKTKPEHALILAVFFVIGVSGFFAEAFRIAEVGQDALAALVKQRALVAQADAPRAAVKQAHAQLFLQPRHALADSRGRHAEQPPGRHVTARFRRAHEGGDAIQIIHASLFRN